MGFGRNSEKKNEIEKAFNGTFTNWAIRLLAEAPASRLSGKLVNAGWTIEYLFGHEGDTEHLNYYVVHRMTNDHYMLIHSDSLSETLETPLDFVVYPENSGEAARQEAREAFRTNNRAVYQRLREKGFGFG